MTCSVHDEDERADGWQPVVLAVTSAAGFTYVFPMLPLEALLLDEVPGAYALVGWLVGGGPLVLLALLLRLSRRPWTVVGLVVALVAGGNILYLVVRAPWLFPLAEIDFSRLTPPGLVVMALIPRSIVPSVVLPWLWLRWRRTAPVSRATVLLVLAWAFLFLGAFPFSWSI